MVGFPTCPRTHTPTRYTYICATLRTYTPHHCRTPHTHTHAHRTYRTAHIRVPSLHTHTRTHAARARTRTPLYRCTRTTHTPRTHTHRALPHPAPYLPHTPPDLRARQSSIILAQRTRLAFVNLVSPATLPAYCRHLLTATFDGPHDNAAVAVRRRNTCCRNTHASPFSLRLPYCCLIYCARRKRGYAAAYTRAWQQRYSTVTRTYIAAYQRYARAILPRVPPFNTVPRRDA